METQPVSAGSIRWLIGTGLEIDIPVVVGAGTDEEVELCNPVSKDSIPRPLYIETPRTSDSERKREEGGGKRTSSPLTTLGSDDGITLKSPAGGVRCSGKI